jgi:hypothetical protein
MESLCICLYVKYMGQGTCTVRIFDMSKAIGLEPSKRRPARVQADDHRDKQGMPPTSEVECI